MPPSREFWRGRRVLITGHTGFKGGWLWLWLRGLGANLTGYALAPPSAPNLWQIVGDGGASVIGDVRDADRVRDTVLRADPQVVFHLAAQALVRESYRDPLGTFGTNVLGTGSVLQACRELRALECIVVVTSDKVYENDGAGRPFRETDRLGGHDPYSNSKACSELLTASFRDSFFADGPAVATARAGNVIGGGDWSADRLIPDCVRALTAGRPVTLRYPAAVRPWQHVLEPLGGYLALAEALVRVARLQVGIAMPRLVTSLVEADEDLSLRVDRLLEPAPIDESNLRVGAIALSMAGALIFSMALGSMHTVHRLLELLLD